MLRFCIRNCIAKPNAKIKLNFPYPIQSNPIDLSKYIHYKLLYVIQVPESKELEEFERVVMEGCDSNADGKINKKELTTVLLALAKHSADQAQQ